MIPKVIHYCWFGNTKKNNQVLECIETWKSVLNDYQIIEWNETNYNVDKNSYTKDCFSKKKWAHLSDFARADVLYNYGGIYMDVDVVVNNRLDKFLNVRAFSGFELPGTPFTAVWGSEKGHSWPKMVLDYYEKAGKYFDITINEVVSEILSENFLINKQFNIKQEGLEGIIIYPSNFFTNNIPINFTTHMFHGSWTGAQKKYYEYCNNLYLGSIINSDAVLCFLDSKSDDIKLQEILKKYPIRNVVFGFIYYISRKVFNYLYPKQN
jgi:mannosyltransferase OCH1-like enzyme